MQMHPSILKAITIISLTLLTATCREASSPTGSASLPNMEIVDGANNNGNEHFFFLPPLRPQPVFNGQFDASLSPVVEICVLSECGASAIATYTTTSGTGSEVVRVDPSAEHYTVNWRTDFLDLDPAVTYRIRVLVAGLELGHADVDVVAQGNQLKRVDTDEYIPLLDGRTLPIKFRIENGVAPNRVNITLATDGTGSGTVTISPAGDSCGPDCHQYAEGTAVEIAALANPGSTFTTFAGLGCGTANPCPASATANATVTATFTGNAALILTPPSQDYGSVEVGQASAMMSLTLTNTTAAPIVLTWSSEGPNREEFWPQVSTCFGHMSATSPLPAGSSCLISFIFKPRGTGPRQSTVNLIDADNTSNTASATLTGVGTPTAQTTLSVTPTAWDFGTVGPYTGRLIVTVTNTGAVATALDIPQVVGVNADPVEFSFSPFGAGTTCQVHATTSLAPAGSCTVGIDFVPRQTGLRQATLNFSAFNAATVSVPLRGTGASTTLSVAPTSLDFGTVGPYSGTLHVTVTNTGGASTLLDIPQVLGVNADPVEFPLAPAGPGACVTVDKTSLAAGASCTVGIDFVPHTTGLRQATLTFSAFNATPVSVPLRGTGASTTLSVAPTSLDFGTVGPYSGTLHVTVTNTGGVSTLLDIPQVLGVNADPVEFPVAPAGAGACQTHAKTDLAAGASCTVGIDFVPHTTGLRQATLTFGAFNATPVTVTLVGTGAVTTLSLTPVSHDFGTGTVGQFTGPLIFTVTNTGAASTLLDIPQVLGVNADPVEFPVAPPGAGACQTHDKTNLAAGGSCTIGIYFHPSVSGLRQATLTVGAFNSNSVSASLMGTGVAP